MARQRRSTAEAAIARGAANLGTMFGAGLVETFMGLPAVDLDALPAGLPAVMFGAGAGTSYTNVGAYCMAGPQAIRAAGATYGANLAHQNFDLGGPRFPGLLACDAGDLPVEDGAHAANRRLIRAAAGRILAAGVVPVLLGGDDSAPIPLLQVFEGWRIHVLQIDAREDWRDEVQGNAGGCPRRCGGSRKWRMLRASCRSDGAASGLPGRAMQRMPRPEA